jgi:adenylyltransferase/sulfurtransferase
MVKVKVKFSVIFKELTGTSETEVELQDPSIRGLINELTNIFGPPFGERILDPKTGGLRRFVNIFVNGRDIRNLNSLDTSLKDGDEIRIIPAVAGGEFFGFTQEQIVRYSRQLILKEVGGRGQRTLRKSKILVVGAGGLGSPALIYLAAAGVGKLGVVDFDCVDLSNLHRQPLHSTRDVGKRKVESAKETLTNLNPEIEVVTYDTKLSPDNVFEIIDEWDFIVDGSDNFPTKFLLNDACVLKAKPLSHGGVLRFVGMTTTIIPKETPCYRCITPEAPPPGMIPTCQEAGVLGVVPGIIGTIQATEALKYVLGIGSLLRGRLLFFDALDMRWEEFELQRRPDCPICGEAPKIKDLSQVDYGHVCEVRF